METVASWVQAVDALRADPAVVHWVVAAVMEPQVLEVVVSSLCSQRRFSVTQEPNSRLTAALVELAATEAMPCCCLVLVAAAVEMVVMVHTVDEF